jgi:hypothetical protein
MDTYGKIATKIREIARKGKVSETLILPAQVKSINGNTCAVNIDDLEVTDVRLRAVINSESEQLLITPKIDSFVLIADLSGGSFTNFAVIAYSEVEAVNIKIGSQTVDIDKNGIICNDGHLGGLIEIEKLTAKLNALVKDFNTHTHPVPGVTTGNGSATSSVIIAQAQTFDKSDYENIKIKH